MELQHKDKRDGYVYDVAIKGNDTSFWKAVSGALSVASNKLRFNASVGASYLMHAYGDFEFALNVPTAPTGGDARHWGLRFSATDRLGAAYFKVAGTAFTAETADDQGNTKTTTLTWSAGYTATETRFRIIWEPDRVIFMINGSVVATHAGETAIPAFPNAPLPLKISNTNADNMDLGYVGVRHAASIV